MSKILNLVTKALSAASGAKTDASVLARLKAGDDVLFVDLDMDSLARFEVIMQIEDAFEIELDEDEVLEQGSVKALVQFIENRVQSS